MTDLQTITVAEVRARLLAREETALIDLREENPFAQSHPLWAANLPLSRIELDAWRRIPRRDTLTVLYGEHDGEDLVARAAVAFAGLGYTHLRRLEGGLGGWKEAGGELFRDVNVPSKAFGELVDHERQTPSLSAQDVKELIDAQADVVVVDARRFDEYQTMSIPSATSVPGAELVLRVRELAPDAATQVIVNCAGRTRSIIGTQSLVNAGIPNRVAALRNGTIGWKLGGQVLTHGATRRAPTVVDEAHHAQARADARRVAGRAGVRWIAFDALSSLREPGRTLYCFDVRSPEQYEAAHVPGFANAPGGQLVQETDHQVPVRGARIVLVDDDGVRAPMTGSWLAQMGWEVHVVEPETVRRDLVEKGQPQAAYPAVRAHAQIGVAELAGSLHHTAVVDVTTGANYARRHIAGAWFAIRAQLAQALVRIPPSRHYVLTCGSGLLAGYAAADLRAALDARGQGDATVTVLAGGNAAWFAAGLPTGSGDTRLATPRTDRYRRPYEGTDASADAMQAYLDWEFGLVDQLRRDGTHNFKVL